MGTGSLKRIAAHTILATVAVLGLGALAAPAQVTLPGTTVTVPSTKVTVTTPTVRVPSTAPTPPPAPKVTAPAPKPPVKVAPVVKQVTKPVNNVTKPVNNVVQKTTPKVTGTVPKATAPVKKTTGTVKKTVGSVGSKVTGGGGSGGAPSGPAGPVTKVVTTVKGSLDSTTGVIRDGGGSSGGGTSGLVNSLTGTLGGSATGLAGSGSRALGGSSAGAGSLTLVRTADGRTFLAVPGGSGPGGPGDMFGGGGAGGGGLPGALAGGGGSLAMMLAGASPKQLRNVLSHLEGCLPSLPALDRRVISMRAGLNGAPLSRPQVGQRLGMSRQQVRSTERRAFNRLQYAAANTGCAGNLVGPFDVAGIGNLMPQLLFAGAVPVNGGAVSLASGASDPFAQARGIVSRSASPLFDLGEGGGSGPAWAIILFTVLFSVSIAALTRELRSSF